jgi:hypothetical protein
LGVSLPFLLPNYIYLSKNGKLTTHIAAILPICCNLWQHIAANWQITAKAAIFSQAGANFM